MLDIERHAAPAAVDAFAVELLKEVLLEFVACKFALLIPNAGNIRVLHQLRVELHEFLNETAHRRKPAKSVYPTRRCFDTVPERRRKPSFRLSAVQKPRCTVAEIAASSAASQLTSGRERITNGSASVPQIDEEKCMVLLLFVFPNNGKAGLFRAGIELHQYRLNDRIGQRPIDQTDRERPQAMHPRPSGFEELSRPRRPAGHQRLVVLVQDKDFHHVVYLTVTDEPLAERVVSNRNVPLANVNDQRFQRQTVSRFLTSLSASAAFRARS